MNEPQSEAAITTHSIEEALDFGCNLLTSVLESLVAADPSKAPGLLNSLLAYISVRYAGEDELALEFLVDLGHACGGDSSRMDQFWRQMRWAARKMGWPESKLTEKR